MFKLHHDITIAITFGVCNNWECGLNLIGLFGNKNLSIWYFFHLQPTFSLLTGPNNVLETQTTYKIANTSHS